MSFLDRKPEPCAILANPNRRHYSYVLNRRNDGAPGREGKSLCGRICGDHVALLDAGQLTPLVDLPRCGGCLRALGIDRPRKKRTYVDPNAR